jgi:hypothetical protein
LAARAPKLNIFGDSLVLRDDNGWQITDIGRHFLASLEEPVASQHERAPKADVSVSTAPPLPAPPALRLVVDNTRRPYPRPGSGPTLRSA